MRNYIILNGVNSNTLTGLLISKLPPISKPKQRNTIEEIDGRDGDIVTTLGYGAYDKQIEIGLYGNFDINEVIEYFNGEGTVVFSNESDKYYNYQILEQIDYEKLIRFKTATVKMHVQPFKYPLEETPVEIAYQYVNNEAEEMALDNTADAPMNIDLKGNTQQNGEPTPDSPIPIQVVSGDNTIYVCGSNIFDGEGQEGGWEQKIGSTLEKIYSRTQMRCKNIMEVQPNTNYVFMINGKPITENTRYIFADENNIILSSIATANGEITTPNNCKHLVFHSSPLKTNYDTTLPNAFISNYHSQLISLGDIELCKIGNYQDYIYKENKKWYLHKEIEKTKLLSSTTWYTSSTYGGSFYADITSSTTIAYSQLYCTHFTRANIDSASQTSSNYTYGTCFMERDIGQVNFWWNNGATDVSNFKTWLDNNDVYIYYPLATPTYTEITDSTLIEQLNNLANVRSYDTSTHITQNANDKPFILNATALQKGSDTGVVNNIGNIYSKPTIDIEGTGTIGVYLEGNQMFNVDLSNSNEIIIDTTNLEAYDPTTNALMNRQVTGDYSNFKLNVGNNNVKVTGNVTKATITNYVRWL